VPAWPHLSVIVPLEPGLRDCLRRLRSCRRFDRLYDGQWFVCSCTNSSHSFALPARTIIIYDCHFRRRVHIRRLEHITPAPSRLASSSEQPVTRVFNSTRGWRRSIGPVIIPQQGRVIDHAQLRQRSTLRLCRMVDLLP